MKGKFTYSLGALIIVICAGIPILYFISRLVFFSVSFFMTEQADQTFLDNAMGNWFATTAGLIGGIPIAFWINRRQAEREQRIQNQERNLRREHILKLITSELAFNAGVISDLLREQDDGGYMAYTTGLKNELWTALSAGTDLQFIEDFKALADISDAYYHIRALMSLEHHYFTHAFYEGMKGATSKAWAEEIVSKVNGIRPGALTSIEKAVQTIYDARRQYY